MKTFRRWILIFVICLGIADHSRAAAPIILGAGIELFLASEALPMATLASSAAAGLSSGWAAVVGGLTASIGYLALKDAANNAVRVPVSGSTASVPPVPSSQGVPGTAAVSNSCSGYASCESFCAAAGFEAAFPGLSFSSVYYDTQNHLALCMWVGPQTGGTPNQWVNGSIAYMGYSTGCPPGYSGGGCALSDVRRVAVDTRCDLSRSGTTYTFYSDDPDCALSGAIKGAINSGAFSVSGVDSFGNPVVTTVTPLGDGGTQISQSVQTRDGSGSSTITEKIIRLNQDGNPLENSQTVRPGSVQFNTTNIQTSTINNAGSSSVVNNSSGSSQSITFPDDYNREATQQAIKTDIHSMVTSSSVTDPTPATADDVSPLLFVSTFSNLLSWSLPAHTSTCPAPTITAFDTDFTFDTHCTIAASLGSELQSSFALMWLLLALVIVLSA